jgi:hypothetical protein
MDLHKEVYQLDAEGFLVGPAMADRLIDGTWQIPAGCITRKPPIARPGYRRRWDGKKWIQVNADGGASV